LFAKCVDQKSKVAVEHSFNIGSYEKMKKQFFSNHRNRKRTPEIDFVRL